MPPSTSDPHFPPTAGSVFMADITAMDAAGAIQAPSAGGGGGGGSGVGGGGGCANRTSHSSLDFRKDFFFRRRHGALNWRKVLSVDLERVVRTVDVDALQDNVEHLTFCDVGEADLAMLTDANFLQLYRLTQLIVEYLLNVQNFLLASAQKKEAVHAETARQIAAERARADQAEEEARSLRREVKYCRRVIRAYERSAGSKWSQMAPEQNQEPQKCGICGSAFVNYEFLRGHYSRRHPGEALPPPPAFSDPAASAAAAGAGASGAPTAQDFVAWKREMESTLRAQLADEARHAATTAAAAAAAATAAASTQNAASKSALEESELARRLAHMESTLAAVLAHTQGSDSGSSTFSRAAPGQSRARGLRDDDGHAASRAHDAEEDPAGVKEYVRRQMFDLVEEVRALKEGQLSQHAHPHQQQSQQPQKQTDMPLDEQLSPRSSLHAQELLQRYRPTPSPARSPHPPEHSQQVALPQGVGTVPRHVPVQHLAPVPPPAHAAGAAAAAPSPSPSPSPAPSAIELPSSPRSLRSLRDLILSHEEKRHEPFAPDLPGLYSRWHQSEGQLVANLGSFAAIASAVAQHGEGGLREIEAELAAQGYADLQDQVQSQLEEYVRAHWAPPPQLLLARRALAEREARNEGLQGEWAAQQAREAAERAAFLAQRDALESAVLHSENQREDHHAQRDAAQSAALAQAREDERRMAEQLREAQEREAIRRAQEPGGLTQMQPLQPTAQQQPPTPLQQQQLHQQQQQQQQQQQHSSARPPAINPYPSPSPSGSPSAIGTPRPYPSPSPAPALYPPPLPAQSPSSGAQPSYSRAPSLAAPAGAYNQHPSASPTPAPTASSFGGNGPVTQRQVSLRRPGTLRTMEEEDSDYDESPAHVHAHAHGLARSGTGATVGAGPVQSQQYVSKPADGSNHPWTPPPAVPVPIPARPLKSAIAAASSAATSTYTSGSLPPRAPGTVSMAPVSMAPPAAPGPDTVEAFVPSGSSTNSSPAGGMRPRPSPHASPIPSMDQVQPLRNPVRRLAAAGDAVEEFNASSDEGDIVNRRSPHAIAAEAAAAAAAAAENAAAAAAASNKRRGSAGSGGGDDVEAFGMDDDGDDTPLKPPAMRVPAGRSLKRGVVGGRRGGAGSGEHAERGEVLEYEHSTARQDREPGPEHEFGGLDDQYEDKDQLGASGTGDAQHFSPAMGARRSLGAGATIGGVGGGGGSGRLHSDDEGDVAAIGGGGMTSRFSGPGAPTLRTRQMGSTSASNPPIHQSTAAGASGAGGVVPHHSRFLGPPVGQSAQFSVASSGDWKSDNDIMDDDLEELIA